MNKVYEQVCCARPSTMRDLDLTRRFAHKLAIQFDLSSKAEITLRGLVILLTNSGIHRSVVEEAITQIYETQQKVYQRRLTT